MKELNLESGADEMSTAREFVAKIEARRERLELRALVALLVWSAEGYENPGPRYGDLIDAAEELRSFWRGNERDSDGTTTDSGANAGGGHE